MADEANRAKSEFLAQHEHGIARHERTRRMADLLAQTELDEGTTGIRRHDPTILRFVVEIAQRYFGFSKRSQGNWTRAVVFSILTKSKPPYQRFRYQAAKERTATPHPMSTATYPPIPRDPGRWGGGFRSSREPDRATRQFTRPPATSPYHCKRLHDRTPIPRAERDTGKHG